MLYQGQERPAWPPGSYTSVAREPSSLGHIMCRMSRLSYVDNIKMSLLTGTIKCGIELEGEDGSDYRGVT